MNSLINLADTRLRIFLILILVWFISLTRSFSPSSFFYPLISVVLFVILDVLFHFKKAGKFYPPYSSLVSGILIGLIIDPGLGIFPQFIAVISAFLSKHFLRYKSRHIFNPAAFGIITSSLILEKNISWWAVAPGGISIIAVLISCIVLWKIRRIYIPLIFLTGYFLYQAILNNPKTALILTLDGTSFLFSFIMLPEPMTTKTLGSWKYGSVILVLGLVIIMTLKHISFTDPFLFSLLASNLIEQLF